MWRRKDTVKRFVDVYFALHRQQLEKDKENFNVPPPEKSTEDAHATDFRDF